MRIATASYDETVQVWEAKTGHHLLTYKGHSAPAWSVACSPDGARIVSGTGAAGSHGPVTTNNSVQVWDATTGKTLLTLAGLAGQAYALSWSHDGTRIAAGGDDHLVHIWDVATGREILEYKGHSDSIFGTSWSPDDTLIASASVDGTVQVWRPQAT
jgi:WD40 repeat protein